MESVGVASPGEFDRVAAEVGQYHLTFAFAHFHWVGGL